MDSNGPKSFAERTINTGGHGPGGAGHLSREAGTFDGLRSLLNLVLVAAAMGSDHLAGSCLHMYCERERERQSIEELTDTRPERLIRRQNINISLLQKSGSTRMHHNLIL